jgi:hypothetical protein
MIGRALNAPAEIPMTPSATPFQYIFLGTEPAITTPLLEGSAIAPSSEVFPTEVFPSEGFPTQGFPTPRLPTQPNPGFPTSTRSSSVSTPLVLNTVTSGTNVARTSTASRVPSSTATSGTATLANTYDDTDSRLLYNGTWVAQTGVSGAHQNTLHVSNTVGDSVTFTFTGPQIHVFYQSGPSLGAITITIDGLGAPALSQAQSQTQIKEWVSDLLPAGTHEIVVEHHDGGSVNIDSLYVPAPTPTPTRTPTPNP